MEKIQRVLSENGARKIMFDYGEGGELNAIAFLIVIGGKEMSFRLPAMVDNVVHVLYGTEDRYGQPVEITTAKREQAHSTAWANIRD